MVLDSRVVVVESESVESHVFSWSRSRWSRMFSAGVGVGFSKLHNINCLKIITGYCQY